MKFLPVPVEHIDEKWQYIEPHLNRAVCISPRKVTIEDVYEASKLGEYMIWTVIDNEKIIAVFTSRIISHPRGNILGVDFAGGEKMKDWIGLVLLNLEAHARHNKCTSIEAFGRKGWEKILNKYGCKIAYTTYKKEL